MLELGVGLLTAAPGDQTVSTLHVLQGGHLYMSFFFAVAVGTGVPFVEGESTGPAVEDPRAFFVGGAGSVGGIIRRG